MAKKTAKEIAEEKRKKLGISKEEKEKKASKDLEKKMGKVKDAPKLEDRPVKPIRTHTGVTIPSIDPENKKLSKAQFKAKRANQRVKALKMSAYEKKIDDGEE